MPWDFLLGACRAVNAALGIKCKVNSFRCDYVCCAILSTACALVCNRNQKQKKHSLAEATARPMELTLTSKATAKPRLNSCDQSRTDTNDMKRKLRHT